MIILKNVSRSFGEKEVLKDISFSIEQGSFTTLFGPNGCGKSTLVNIIAGIDKDYSGSIEGLENIKGKIAYVFQDYRRSLLPWGTVKDNILFPLKLRGVSRSERNKKLKEIMEFSGIDIDLKQRVQSLSGGQAQAVCILRALIINPKLLILDEPFAALDFERTLFLRQMASNIAHNLNLSVLFISHDLEEAVVLGDQVLFLSRTPTVVKHVLKVDLAKPRQNSFVTKPEFLAYKESALGYFTDCCQ